MTPFGRLKTLYRFVQIPCLAFAALCNLPNANAGFSFTPSHIYSTSTFGNTTNVMEYTADGTFLGSLTIPSLVQGDELRGIAFGTDGLLYAVMVHFSDSGFQVLALDSSGTVHQTYRMGGVDVWGNASSGGIALDQQHIYVGGGDDLVRFTIGNPTSGMSIYTNNQVFDVNVLPNGHLFVCSAYQVDEIMNTGGLVRTVVFTDGINFVDMRGIAYNPDTNKLFITQYGTTGSTYSILRVNAATGEIETGTRFNNAIDLFLTDAGTLVVGNTSETARIYDQNMILVGPLGTDQRQFVTQYPTGGGPTPTPTPTPTPCTGRCSPTPRPRPTPYPRL
jgi:hypothetical protein